MHSPRAANCRKYEISRNSEDAHAKDEAVSEQNTLQVLLDISDKHAPSGAVDKKVDPFTVAKEIHQSFETMFKDGTTHVKTYQNLKTLSPLLDFEQ